MARHSTEVLFHFDGLDYTAHMLASMSVGDKEKLLESVGAGRERQGLLVARTARALEDARQKYKQLTEARNNLKGILVPGAVVDD